MTALPSETVASTGISCPSEPNLYISASAGMLWLVMVTVTGTVAAAPEKLTPSTIIRTLPDGRFVNVSSLGVSVVTLSVSGEENGRFCWLCRVLTGQNWPIHWWN